LLKCKWSPNNPNNTLSDDPAEQAQLDQVPLCTQDHNIEDLLDNTGDEETDEAEDDIALTNNNDKVMDETLQTV